MSALTMALRLVAWAIYVRSVIATMVFANLGAQACFARRPPKAPLGALTTCDAHHNADERLESVGRHACRMMVDPTCSEFLDCLTAQSMLWHATCQSRSGDGEERKQIHKLER